MDRLYRSNKSLLLIGLVPIPTRLPTRLPSKLETLATARLRPRAQPTTPLLSGLGTLTIRPPQDRTDTLHQRHVNRMETSVTCTDGHPVAAFPVLSSGLGLSTIPRTRPRRDNGTVQANRLAISHITHTQGRTGRSTPVHRSKSAILFTRRSTRESTYALSRAPLAVVPLCLGPLAPLAPDNRSKSLIHRFTGTFSKPIYSPARPAFVLVLPTGTPTHTCAPPAPNPHTRAPTPQPRRTVFPNLNWERTCSHAPSALLPEAPARAGMEIEAF